MERFKNGKKIQADILKYIQDQPIFVFNIDNIIFQREVSDKTNFISIYYQQIT